MGRHVDLAAGGDVLSVGCGWHPGRHLFPAPAWRMTANDADAARARWVVEEARPPRADVAAPGRAGELDGLPDASFDVILYRLVLHHIVFQQSLDAVFAEAARLLRPGGVAVAVEPGRRHPVGAALALANRAGLGTAVHGTPDDVPSGAAPTGRAGAPCRAGTVPARGDLLVATTAAGGPASPPSGGRAARFRPRQRRVRSHAPAGRASPDGQTALVLCDESSAARLTSSAPRHRSCCLSAPSASRSARTPEGKTRWLQEL